MLATIPLIDIEPGLRLREISESQVEMLVNSISDIGLLNPITVYSRKIIRGGISVDGYGLVAGAHRLEASKRLGLVDIDAHVVELGELERQIAECDENLCATVLSPTDRTRFTKRRKEAYEALHPETRHGATGGTNAGKSRSEVAKIATSVDRFTADTAAKTGQSERVVQLYAERGEKVIEEVLDLIRGTKLDTGTYLDKLKKLSPNDQVTASKRDLVTLKQKKKQNRNPSAPLNDIEARDQWLASGASWWSSGSKEWQEEFLSRNGIPVFDRKAGAA